MPKAHPSLAFLEVPGSKLGCDLPDALEPYEGDPDGEWWDTGAVFSPAVLSLYPSVPPYPGANGYSVGYGSLVAVDELLEQVAYYEGEGVWKEG